MRLASCIVIDQKCVLAFYLIQTILLNTLILDLIWIQTILLNHTGFNTLIQTILRNVF